MIEEKIKETLNKYIIPEASNIIADWIIQNKVKLIIKSARKTKLGDFRVPVNNENPVITINHDLNQYAFLFTLIHEFAHLSTFLAYGNKVAAHGAEWKNEFKKLFLTFNSNIFFPEELLEKIHVYFQKTKASTCSDPELYLCFRTYDKNRNENLKAIQDIPIGMEFEWNKKQFQLIEKRRTRYLCLELKSQKRYLFRQTAEVLLS